MADKSFFGRLNRLFSGGTIVTKTSGGLKILDINKVQANDDFATNRLVDRYNRLHTTSISTGYSADTNFHTARIALFTDYEVMDEDSIISAALDIYADECTMKNEYGDVLKITTDKQDVQKVLNNLFYDVLNIEYNLWPWIRNMVKYGDFYLKLDITEKVGVTNAMPLSTYELQREEGWNPKNPDEVRFLRDVSAAQNYTANLASGPKTYFDNYEIAHFRLLSDTNFLPYGKSMIESARKTWKQLTLMEDAMMIHRIMRAPEKRVFKIDIGNIPPNEVDAYMQRVMNNMKKTPYVGNDGNYNLKFNIQNMMEDFYLPVRGGQSGTEIDSLGGMEFGGIDDVEYLKNRMMAALQIPKAFLGFEEGVEGKATLAAQDVRFARTIERIQKIVVSELYKIAMLHLYSQGFKSEDLLDFNLSLTPSSKIYEQEQLELWNTKVSLARDLQEGRMLSQEWIYKNVYNLNDNEIKTEMSKVLGDMKFKLRQDEIEQGNDPAESGIVVATDYALAQAGEEKVAEPFQSPLFSDDFQDSVDKADQGENMDRKKKYGNADSARGRDPLGKDKAKRTVKFPDRSIQHNFRESYIKELDKIGKSTLLSENNIVDDE